VSLAHSDAAYRQKIEVQLKALKDRNLIEYWSDNELFSSSRWEEKIKAEMDKANVFLLLLSQEFIVSDFISREEIPYARRRVEEGIALVISIGMRPVNLACMLPELKEFQVLPTGMRPVSRWGDEDEA
jgi:hypothetical protein